MKYRLLANSGLRAWEKPRNLHDPTLHDCGIIYGLFAASSLLLRACAVGKLQP